MSNNTDEGSLRYNDPSKPQSPELSWRAVQPFLEGAPYDVLLLLDCCFAASAARAAVSGINELLAACGRDHTTVGVGPDSFTIRLIEAIKAFGGKAFTVLRLYERLIQNERHLTTPQYHLLGRCGTPSALTPSIVLERLQLASRNDILEQPTDMLAASATKRPPQDSQEPLVPSSIELSSSSGEIRVLLTLSLPGDASVPDLQRWNDWLSDVPCDV